MRFIFILTALFISASAFSLEAPKGFKREKVNIDGINFNVYKGGTGEPLILLHGYAQSSLMWRKAMEHFQDQFTIIAPDLRGVGQTDAPESGYDKMTMATDVKKIMEHYNIPVARVVGHDVGLMVAYTLAAAYPEKVSHLVVMDAFLPGVGPGDEIYNDPTIWHFRFNGPYPEKLVEGRERIFFDSLWEGFSAREGTFPEESKKHYLSEYSRPGRMKAGWSYFKTFPQDAETNRNLSKTKLQIPVLAMGGEKALGQKLVDTMKVAANSVEGVVVKNCGHWMLEECPKESIEALDAFLMKSIKTKQAQEQD